MQPTALVKEVSRQALQRHASRMKESELRDLEDHNTLISNMQALDHSLELKKAQRRRMNEQNQQYLRIQMKQKEDGDKFATAEHRGHKNTYDYTAPEERFDHLHKVRSL